MKTNKTYSRPEFKVVKIELAEIIAGSGTTGASGENAGWDEGENYN